MSSAVPPWNGAPATLPAAPPMNTPAACEGPAAAPPARAAGGERHVDRVRRVGEPAGDLDVVVLLVTGRLVYWHVRAQSRRLLDRCRRAGQPHRGGAGT